jgi:tetratricopeptide (TPR) repeat protein
VFDLQDQVASAVVGVIDPRVLDAEISRSKRKPPDSLDAYDCFLRAIDHCYRWTPEDTKAALRLLYRAIELDPGYAQAYAQACWCQFFPTIFGPGGLTTEARREIVRLAQEAVRLGRDDAFSLVWAGWTFALLGDLDKGTGLVERALALNPNLARSWNLSGWVRVWRHEPDTGIEHFERALRLDPLDPARHLVQEGMAYAHIRAQRYEEAIGWAERALQTHPKAANAARALAIGKALTGQLDEARSAIKRLLEINPAARLANLPMLLYVPAEFQARVADALREAGMPD